jgi:hypothetical protein
MNTETRWVVGYLLIAFGILVFVGYLGLLGWVPLGALCAWIVLAGQLRPQAVTPCSGT